MFIYLNFNTFLTLLTSFYKIKKLLTIIKIKNFIFDTLYIITPIIYSFFVKIKIIIAVKITIIITNFRKFNLL